MLWDARHLRAGNRRPCGHDRGRPRCGGTRAHEDARHRALVDGAVGQAVLAAAARTGARRPARLGGRRDLPSHEQRPWAIDPAFLTPSPPLTLTDMAVRPTIRERALAARARTGGASGAGMANGPATRFRLDAYDANAGAGEFYASCGFREVASVVYRDVRSSIRATDRRVRFGNGPLTGAACGTTLWRARRNRQ